MGNLEPALADINKAIDLSPSISKFYFVRARIYESLSRLEPALQDMTTVIRHEPGNAEAYRRRADLSLALSRYDAAVADYTRAIERNVGDAWCYVSRAQAYELAHKYLEARDDFERALQLDPTNVDVLNACAWLLATCPEDRVRSGPQAFAHASRACELTQWKNPALLDTLAAACAERGDFDAAVKWEAKAIGLKRDDAAYARDAQSRLEKYRALEPYRDEPARDSPPAQPTEPVPQSE